jgi:hypothetical protein
MALGVGDVVRVSAIMRDGRGQDVINTFDVEITTAGSGGNDGFKEDAAEWLTDMYTNLIDVIKDDNVAVAVGFYQRNGLEVLTPISWAGPNFNALDQELPFGTAALVYARTTQRHVIARKFIGPMTEGSNVNGVLAGATVAALEGFIGDWLGTVSVTNGWVWDAVVWPRTNTGSIPITEGLVSDVWAIQRRRRRGRGS